jgi:tRNA threonylcarbamoyladenosine biosynthesis protein TsaE
MVLFTRTYDLQELPEVAKALVACIGSYRLLIFEGELGAGKTTVISALCKELGVVDAVGSPTFSLVNQYAMIKDGNAIPIYHMDLYRISGEEEAVQAGIEDHLFSGNLCLVEWPQRAPGILPPHYLRVVLTAPDPGHRSIAVMTNEN